MSWDGTLSSGGITKHGTAAHNTTGVTPGFYNSPAGITVDATGAITAAYQAWSTTPTYLANTLVLGSDSKLYKAVISNQGHDPTTDGGTNWMRVSIPQKPGGTPDFQTPVWDPTASEYLGTSLLKLNTTTNTAIVAGALDMSTHQIHNVVDPTAAQDAATKAYVDAQTGGSGLPSGTDTQMLRNNAGTWVSNSFLANNGSQVTINSPTSPTSTVPLVIKVAGTGSSPSGLEVQDETATDPCSLAIKNTGSSTRLEIGIAGGTSDFITGTAQGDGILRHQVAGKRFWIGSKINVGDTTGTPIASFSQTGVTIGSGTGGPAAKLDVTAASGQQALKLTGASGQVVLNIVSSSSPSGAIAVNGDNATVSLVSSAALGGGSGGTLLLATSNSPNAANQTLGAIYFGGSVSGVTSQAWLVATSAESWTSGAKGVHFGFFSTPPGQTTVTEKLRLWAQGDVSLFPVATPLSSGSTTGFTHLPSMSGAPTGVPANLRGGATPVVIDTTNIRRYHYIGSSWLAQGIGHTMLTVVNLTTPPTNPLTYNLAVGVGLVLCDTSNGFIISVVLPAAAANTGRVVTVKNIPGGLANTSVSPASGESIDGSTPGTINLTTGQRATLASNGSGWFRID